jgi:hypothetical protein
MFLSIYAYLFAFVQDHNNATDATKEEVRGEEEGR